MAAAIRAYGRDAVAGSRADTSAGDPELLGKQLLHIFGPADSQARIADAVTELVRDPASEHGQDLLTGLAFDACDSDHGMTDEAAAAIAAFHRYRADAGDLQALIDLGNFLYWDEPLAARAAYQEAIDSGYLPALLRLGKLAHVQLRDEEEAMTAYQQAVSSGNADLAAEAMYEIAFVHVSHRDKAAAAATLQRVIDTRHPEWAAAAMVGLADAIMRKEDPERAEALYREAIQAGNADWSAHAACSLGDLLEQKGDLDGAKAAWQQVIDSRNPDWAGNAFTGLVNLLASQDDADGLRAAYSKGAALENPDALYAVTQLGQVLEQQGDIPGAHQAWQQAIDAGCEEPDYWRERITPPPPPRRQERAPYPPDLPAEFNPANMIRTCIQVLEHGLLPLPQQVTYDMAIPAAYWTTGQQAVVLVLSFSRWTGDQDQTPMITMATFARDGDTWIPPRHGVATSWSHDPISSPDSQRDLGGQAMVTCGGTETIMHGRLIPAIRELALIQDGHEERRLLDSHFGAWVVCTDRPAPFEVEARDADGNALARISHLPCRPPE